MSQITTDWKAMWEQCGEVIYRLEHELADAAVTIRGLEAEITKLKERPTWADGFNKGREAVLRNNESGCCCLFNEDEEIVSVCGAHKEREAALQAEANKNDEKRKTRIFGHHGNL
jgi:hypothetical protein